MQLTGLGRGKYRVLVQLRVVLPRWRMSKMGLREPAGALGDPVEGHVCEALRLAVWKH